MPPRLVRRLCVAVPPLANLPEMNLSHPMGLMLSYWYVFGVPRPPEANLT
jgi:hypothetical protein